MKPWRSISRRLTVLAACATLAVGATGSTATATTPSTLRYATESATSSNWAGYAVSGESFTSVEGDWVIPTADDTTDGYSAAWVGLGGADSTSTALEQVGTESDYVDGQATYSAWYELLPDAPVTLNLDVSPGDKMHAAVTVDGTTVTITLSNLTTGKSTTKTLHMSDPDTTSAEWIAEAP